MDCSICTHFLGNFILADDFSNCLVKNHACIWRKPHQHVISKNAFLISAPLVMGEQWGPIQNKHLSFFFLFFSLVSHIESISNFFWLSFDSLLTTSSAYYPVSSHYKILSGKQCIRWFLFVSAIIATSFHSQLCTHADQSLYIGLRAHCSIRNHAGPSTLGCWSGPVSLSRP